MGQTDLNRQKICTKCQIKKPIIDYYKSKQHEDNLRPICKSCDSKNYVKWYKANRDKQIKRASDWAKENKEKANKRARKWVENNPEKRKQVRLDSDARNSKKKKIKSKKYREENKEKLNKIYSKKKTIEVDIQHMKQKEGR